MSFICYQSVFVTVVHAYFNGMMIEGGARWGFDPVWEADDIPMGEARECKKAKVRGILQSHL
jgi:hypothetical protein